MINNVPSMFLGTAPFAKLGDYRFRQIRTINAVRIGVNMGCGIDCAVAYGNHRQVRRGLQASGKKREDFFLASKLYNDQQDSCVAHHYTVMCSELGVDYLDLLLLHWPQVSTYISAWKQLETLYFQKRVRYIGMANVEIGHLMEVEKRCNLLPHVIQIERHPLNTQSELISFCREKEIQVQAYSPLARMNPVLIEHKAIKAISKKHQKSATQIILRWHIQTDVIPVVRSVRKHRIIENLDIWDFRLSDEEVSEITDINSNEYYRINDPRRFVRYY